MYESIELREKVFFFMNGMRRKEEENVKLINSVEFEIRERGMKEGRNKARKKDEKREGNKYN